MLWNATSNVSIQGIRLLFGIILARLLTPEDFGIVGLLTVFMCIVSIFIDCGFSQALIAKQKKTQVDFSTEFWFNVVFGILAYLTLFVLSPYVASFYNKPILSSILKILGIEVIINSLCVVQSAQFTIALNFRTPAKISIISQFISGCIGIFLAQKGFGVWSLVYQQLLGNLINGIGLWSTSRWLPTLHFSFHSFKYLWSYGSKVLAANVFSQLYDNIQPLIIGKAFSAESLGQYTRAQQFAAFPSTNLSSILGNVTFPILSKVNDDIIRIKSIYNRMIRVTGFIVFPLMIGLAAIAAPLIHALFNNQWNDCIFLLQIISIALMWQPISFINLNLLKALNRPDIVLKLELIKKPLGIGILLFSIQYGLTFFALCNVVICLFAVIVNTIYVSMVLNESVLIQFKELFKPLTSSMLMGLCVYSITQHISNAFVALSIGVFSGFCIYLLISRLIMKSYIEDFLSIMKRDV